MTEPASSSASAIRPLDPELEHMLRELRTLGAKRNAPCGVHDSPQWTCAFCLHNVLERVEVERLRSSVAAPPEVQRLQAEKDEWIARFNKLPEIVARAEERGRARSSVAAKPERNEAMNETPDVVKVIGACPRCGGLPGPFIREAHQRLDEIGVPRNNSGGYFLSLVQRINLLYNECETTKALLKERSHETR